MTVENLPIDPVARVIHQREALARERREIDQRNREGLFEDETLVIKLLQAVSGAGLIGTLAQATTLTGLAGKISFLILVSAQVIGLLAAVFCAHWKHQYRLYLVGTKAPEDSNAVSKTVNTILAFRYLRLMRIGMWVALLSVATGFVQFLGFLWYFAATSGMS